MTTKPIGQVRNRIDVPVWTATAESAPAVQPLAESLSVDVAIVGGGYTGLSAAIELASQGASVAVLEAGQIGGGASGRNGGQINPGLKLDPADVLAKHGDIADAALNFAGGAPDVVFDLVSRYGIQCHIRRTGWLMPAHRASALPVLNRRAEGWIRRGVPVRTLDKAETEAVTGSRSFAGAIIDPRGGNLQPLSYVRGLARAALGHGAGIFVDTPVRTARRAGDGWTLGTGRSDVRARQVILATNGYTDDLWPGLKQSIVPVHSFQIATVPLGDRLGAGILPQGHHAADTRHLIQYFRRDPAGRMLIGGQGKSGGPKTASDFGHLYRSLTSMYPELAGIEIDFAWSGLVAVTPDYLPHIHEPAPGVTAVLGFNGRGVAMATALGRAVARHVSDPGFRLDIPATSIRKIPFHGLNLVYAAAAAAYFRIRDQT